MKQKERTAVAGNPRKEYLNPSARGAARRSLNRNPILICGCRDVRPLSGQGRELRKFTATNSHTLPLGECYVANMQFLSPKLKILHQIIVVFNKFLLARMCHFVKSGNELSSSGLNELRPVVHYRLPGQLVKVGNASYSGDITYYDVGCCSRYVEGSHCPQEKASSKLTPSFSTYLYGHQGFF